MGVSGTSVPDRRKVVTRSVVSAPASTPAPPPIDITLDVQGMTCASCVNRIERFLQRTDGVLDATVNLATEQAFYGSDLTFRVTFSSPRPQAGEGPGERVEQTAEFVLKAKDSAVKKFKAALGDRPEILSVEWTHRHYVQDDEYIPHGEDIATFLKREIAKPIIRWEDSPQLGYEILPNKYFYRYQSPMPAKDLLAEFWKLEKEAEKMLEGLTK